MLKGECRRSPDVIGVAVGEKNGCEAIERR